MYYAPLYRINHVVKTADYVKCNPGRESPAIRIVSRWCIIGYAIMVLGRPIEKGLRGHAVMPPQASVHGGDVGHQPQACTNRCPSQDLSIPRRYTGLHHGLQGKERETLRLLCLTRVCRNGYSITRSLAALAR